MKIACLQFAPQVGDVDNNLNRADAILSKTHQARLEDLDLLVLPELAFTGYNFKSLNEISPYLELSGFGISSLWARTTALKHNCHVVVGYPEKVDVEPMWPTSPEYYNSCIIVDGDGETVGNYRKSFLDVDERWALEGRDGFFDGEIDGLGRITMGICSDINPYKMEAPWASFEFATHALEAEAEVVIVTMSWPTHEDFGQYSCKPLEPDMAMVVYWAERLEPLIRAENDDETIVVFCNRTGTEGDITYAGSSAVLGIRRGEISVYGILGRGVKELLVVDTDEPPMAKLVDSAISQAPGATENLSSSLDEKPHVPSPSIAPLRSKQVNYPVAFQDSIHLPKDPRTSSSGYDVSPQKPLPNNKSDAKPPIAPLHTSFSHPGKPAMDSTASRSSPQYSPITEHEPPQTAKLAAARLTSPAEQRGPSLGMRRSAVAQCLTINTHVEAVYRKVGKAEANSAPVRSYHQKPGSALSPALQVPKSSVLISPPLSSDVSSSVDSPLLDTPTGPSPLPDDLRPKWDFSHSSSQHTTGLKPLSPGRFARIHPTTTGFLMSPHTPATPYIDLFQDTPPEEFQPVWQHRVKRSNTPEGSAHRRPGSRSKHGSDSFRNMAKTPQPFKSRHGEDETPKLTDALKGSSIRSSPAPRRLKEAFDTAPRQGEARKSDSTCIPIAASPSVFQTTFKPEHIKSRGIPRRTTPTPMKPKEKTLISVPTTPETQSPHRLRSPAQQQTLRSAPSLPQLSQQRSKSPTQLPEVLAGPLRKSKSPRARSIVSRTAVPDHGNSKVHRTASETRSRNPPSTAGAIANGLTLHPQAAETPAQHGSQIIRPHTSQGTRGRVAPFPVLPRHCRQASQPAVDMPPVGQSCASFRGREASPRAALGRSPRGFLGDKAEQHDNDIIATISKVTHNCPAHSSITSDSPDIRLAADGHMYSIAFSEGFQSLANVILPSVSNSRGAMDKINRKRN